MTITSDQVWWTRKSKIQTENRLLRNDFHAQHLIVWYSFFSAAVAIFYLTTQSSATNNAAWVIFSVLSLTISGIVSSMRFRERAYQIKICYEQLQPIIGELQSSSSDKPKLYSKYHSIIAQCENHTDSDYFTALCKVYLTTQDKNTISPHPTCYIWLKFWISVFSYYFFIILLYIIPIVILFVIK